MIRYILVLLICMISLPSARAMLTPRNDLAARREKYPCPFVELIPALAQDPAYRITEQTEVMLDGRKCRYEEVPTIAKIIFMEIESEESKVILRIHFQDRK